jgi:hypothetical protein
VYYIQHSWRRGGGGTEGKRMKIFIYQTFPTTILTNNLFQTLIIPALSVTDGKIFTILYSKELINCIFYYSCSFVQLIQLPMAVG